MFGGGGGADEGDLVSYKGECIGRGQRVQVSYRSASYVYNPTYIVLEGRNGFNTSSIIISDDLDSRMKRINKKNKTIHFIRLFHANGYLISDDEGTEWNDTGEGLKKELKKAGKIEDFSVAKDGTWVINQFRSLYSKHKGPTMILHPTLRNFIVPNEREK